MEFKLFRELDYTGLPRLVSRKREVDGREAEHRNLNLIFSGIQWPEREALMIQKSQEGTCISTDYGEYLWPSRSMEKMKKQQHALSSSYLAYPTDGTASL